MIKNNLKMFELNKELKKADGIIFYPSENLEIEPSVVILVFKSKEKSDKISKGDFFIIVFLLLITLYKVLLLN